MRHSTPTPHTAADPTDTRPTDPVFLFAMFAAANKAGDRMLLRLARDWLAECGYRVGLVRPEKGAAP